MQLRHLAHLVATVDAGSVSAAAAAVHVTQPALSRQLRQLERDLGVELFERTGGRLTPSRTGRALLPQARAVLAAAADLERSAAFHARGGVERLVIAAPTVTLTDVVSPFTVTLAPDDPVVDVRAADGLGATAMLDEGADLALGTQRPQPPYASLPLAPLPVRAFVPAGDPWETRGSIGVAELVTRPLVLLPPAFTSREALDAAVAAAGTSYGAVLEAGNGTIAQALAAAGRGVAVVSDDPRFDLVGVPLDRAGEPVAVHLVVAWDETGVAATTLGEVAARLVRWVEERYGSPALS